MGMSFEQFEYKLCELKDKYIKYKENGKCKHTDCRECDFQNVCEAWEAENGTDD